MTHKRCTGKISNMTYRRCTDKISNMTKQGDLYAKKEGYVRG